MAVKSLVLLSTVIVRLVVIGAMEHGGRGSHSPRFQSHEVGNREAEMNNLGTNVSSSLVLKRNRYEDDTPKETASSTLRGARRAKREEEKKAKDWREAVRAR